MNVRLQEHSSHCLLCHIKGKAKQATELVKFQSVICKEEVRLKRLINCSLKIFFTKTHTLYTLLAITTLQSGLLT